MPHIRYVSNTYVGLASGSLLDDFEAVIPAGSGAAWAVRHQKAVCSKGSFCISRFSLCSRIGAALKGASTGAADLDTQRFSASFEAGILREYAAIHLERPPYSTLGF
jgi:hypothetical protein